MPSKLIALLIVLATAVAPVRGQSEYRIGAEDVLTVLLADDKSLSGAYRVDADGTFTFPLVGKVKAGGLTVPGVEAELRARLAEGYFKDPQVAIVVEEYRSQRIFVVGQVSKPGAYPLTGQTTLLEALAQAGPIADDAGDEIVIVRPRMGHRAEGPVLPEGSEVEEVERIDLQQLQSGALFQGITLRSGDTLFVPRSGTVFVFGQVRTPGSYPARKGTTVLQALSLAGGLTDRGASNRIRIMRTVNGKKQEIKVKLADLVMPGDTIIVRERLF
jgi:polysaccharide export outer membrane protein